MLRRKQAFTLYFKGRHRTSELYNRAFIGNQYARGNIMLYSGNDDTTVFDPFAGREYSELDNGYYKTAIPQRADITMLQ